MMIYLLRRLCVILLFGFICPQIIYSVKSVDRVVSELNKQGTKKSFKFGVLGDSQFTNDSIWAAVLDQINTLQPDFAVQVGDIINGYHSDTTNWSTKWDRAFNILGRMDKVPYLPIPGNHDISRGYTEAEKEWIRRWRRTNYSFEYGNCGFIMFASDLSGGYLQMKAQYDWLKKSLARYKKKRATFVFVHRPLFFTDEEWGPNLRKWFESNNVRYVFYGHEHTYVNEEINGVRYVQTVASAKLVVPEKFGGFHHHLLITVDQDTIVVDIIKNGQVVNPEHFIASNYRGYRALKDKGNIWTSPILIDSKGVVRDSLKFIIGNPFDFSLNGIWRVSALAGKVSLEGLQKTVVTVPPENIILSDTLEMSYTMVADKDFDSVPITAKFNLAKRALCKDVFSLSGKTRNLLLLLHDKDSGTIRDCELYSRNYGIQLQPVTRYSQLDSLMNSDELPDIVIANGGTFYYNSDLLEYFTSRDKKLVKWLRSGGRALFSVPARNPDYLFDKIGVNFFDEKGSNLQEVLVSEKLATKMVFLGGLTNNSISRLPLLVNGFFSSVPDNGEVLLTDLKNRPVIIGISYGKGKLFLASTEIMNRKVHGNSFEASLLWQTLFYDLVSVE